MPTRGTHQVRSDLVGGALPVRIGQAAEHVEAAHGDLRDGLLVVGGDGGRRDGVRRVEGPAVFGAPVLFVDWTVVVVAHAEVEREVALHAPIVLQEAGGEVGIPGAVGVDVEEALRGQPVEELRHVLSHGFGLRGAGGLVHPPVAAEIIPAGAVSIGNGAQAVLTKIGPHLQAVVAFELGPASIELGRLGRTGGGLVIAQRLECGAGVEINVGQRRPHGIGADVAGKAEGRGIEALAGIRGALVHVGVVQAEIQDAGGTDGVDLVEAGAPVFAAGDLAAGNVAEVVVLLGRERVVADVKRHAAAVAHVVIELPGFVVRHG